MDWIIIFLGIIALTWWVLYNFFYSPKALIGRLWKKELNLASELGKMRKGVEMPEVIEGINSAYLPHMEKIGKMINALLDYYFDMEEDEEYIKENRYNDKNKI